MLLKSMEDVGKSAFIHNTALKSNINKRMSKTTVNRNYIWTIFLLSRVLHVSTYSQTRLWLSGPFIRLFNYASQWGTIPYDK